MEETQPNRFSNNTNRKRRSSILKSQRPPRTPFSEVELRVATPTDTCKSRRVSFSRRTSVAEFITNEATTTWRNVYEEHNKSLESSNNESGANAPRQPVGYIGNRIFEQQFQDIEAEIDFVSMTDNPRGRNINTTLNSINFAQQLASPETTNDINLSAPQQDLQISTFTNRPSRLFGDDVTNPTMGEVSQHININFSTVQLADAAKDIDDLDEIERDIAQRNMGRQGFPRRRREVCQYIEVDLDTTHFELVNYESDKSITDIIHSPKVREISNNLSNQNNRKCNNVDKDWVADKENILINPYLAPPEKDNFAVNESPEKVLIFDGKRLKVVSEKDDVLEINTSKRCDTALPKFSMEPMQRKTGTLYSDDDLHKVSNDNDISLNKTAYLCKENNVNTHKHTVLYDDDQSISITQALPNNIVVTEAEAMPSTRRTTLYENDISMTEALPANIILTDKIIPIRSKIHVNKDDAEISVTEVVPAVIILPEKRKTIVFDNENADISMTQPLPANLLLSDKPDTLIEKRRAIVLDNEKRKTIVFDNENADISMTQPLPANLLLSDKPDTLIEKRRAIVLDNEKRKTIVFDDDDGDISITNALPPNIFSNERALATSEKRRTVVYENEDGDISMTQAIPANILLSDKPEAKSEKRRTIVFDDDNSDISTTKALPSNINVLSNERNQASSEKRRTIVYENEDGDISMTQAIPANILLSDKPESKSEKRRTIVFDDDNSDISTTEALPSNINVLSNERNQAPSEKRRTIVYENEDGDISMTQAIPANILLSDKPESKSEKRRTIVFDDDNSDISTTEALPSNINVLSNERNQAPSEKRRTIVYENEDGDISMTQAIPANILLSDKPESKSEKRRTIVFDDDNSDISTTKALPSNINVLLNERNQAPSEKRRTIVYENEDGDISMTQAIPTNILLSDKPETKSEKRRTIVFDDDNSDISTTKALPSNINVLSNERNQASSEKRRTIVYENEDGDISMTQAVPTNILLSDKPETKSEKRRTIVFDDDNSDISTTKISANILSNERSRATSEKRKTIAYENEDGNISITQAIPSNIVLSDKLEILSVKRKTIVFDNNCNIPVIQAVPANIISSENRQTILYDNVNENVSMTRASTTNILLSNKSERVLEKIRTNIFDNDNGDISTTETPLQNIFSNTTTEAVHEKRNTVVYEDESHISIPRAIPTNIPLMNKPEVVEIRRTVIFDNDGNISMTQGIPSNITSHSKNEISVENKKSEINTEVLPNKCKTMNNDNDSITQPLLSDHAVKADCLTDKKETIVDDRNIKNLSSKIIEINTSLERNAVDVDISTTHVLEQNLSNKLIQTKERPLILHTETNKFSTTKPIPVDLLTVEREILNKSKNDVHKIPTHDPAHSVSYQRFVVEQVNQDVMVYQAVTSHNASTIEVKRTQQEKSSIEQALNDCKDEDINSINRYNISEIARLQTDTVLSEKVVKEPKFSEEPQISASDMEFPKLVKKANKSILSELLDMSTASEDGIADKNLMVNIESKPASHEDFVKTDSENISRDSFFFITKESHKDLQIEQLENVRSLQDNPHREIKSNETFKIGAKLPLSLEYKEEDNNPEVVVENKLDEIKNEREEERNSLPQNRYYEKIMSSDLEGTEEKEADRDTHKSNHSKSSLTNKSIRDANDTKELLDMLSDFTDKTISKDAKEVDERSFKVDNCVDLNNELKPIEPQRSFASKRQSIAVNNEELWNNISMAKALLQKSKCNFDNSEYNDDTATETPLDRLPLKKTVRMSEEVVKTLHFEDESISETSLTSDTKDISPLKKTAFGETAYMKESKAKVIPSYLKNVSDGIKELMHDLVKPMADVMPFESTGLDKSLRKVPSTCSTQIQANLITSSQIDIDFEQQSNSDNEMEKMHSEVVDTSIKATSHALKSPIRPILKTEQKDNYFTQQKTSPAKILVFDHQNPLNNVLLAPVDFSEAHRYNPGESTETLCVSERSQSAQISVQENEDQNGTTEEKVFTQYNVGNCMVVPQPHDLAPDVPNAASDVSKPMSVDQSTTIGVPIVKDTEINTLIAMKGNKELLDASSSLTLVDEAPAATAFDVKINTHIESHNDKPPQELQVPIKSPVRVIYKMIHQQADMSGKLDSDFTSNEDDPPETVSDTGKASKRRYSPVRRDKEELTPKPNSKMQKLSNSPNAFNTFDVQPEQVLKGDKIEKSQTDSGSAIEVVLSKCKDNERYEDRSYKKSNESPKGDKPGTTVTVQHLITEYQINTDIDQETLNKQNLKVLKDRKTESSMELQTISAAEETRSLETLSSFASNNIRGDKAESVTSSADSVTSYIDLPQEVTSESSSKNLAAECDSSANVVAKIDMLPFMGSECTRERCNGSRWSFILMRGRVRLSTRLAHRAGDAPRRCVRADTPLEELHVEATQHEFTNPVAGLCVRYAAEAMTLYAQRAQRRAGALPTLLRRCAAVARLALRWARHMHHEQLKLAYNLTDDGHLALKVVNVPLRSVWEVTMRIELSEETGRCPRATDVRVTRVIADTCPSEAQLDKMLASVPRDWGHVPNTIRKIFKHLKHKRPDDELLLGI